MIELRVVGGRTHEGGWTSRSNALFGNLGGVYRDRHALDALAAEEPGRVAYEVLEHRQSTDDGDVVFGQSTIAPGMVGDEFAMTRGHLHEIADRAEVYVCLAGAGLMLLDGPGGLQTVPMVGGDIAYVAPDTIHRSVNTGSEPLVLFFSYGADAGHDYGIIARENGMALLVVSDGAGGWTTRPNPDHRRSRPGPQ